jgi:deoxyribose-phosphate aldolase
MADPLIDRIVADVMRLMHDEAGAERQDLAPYIDHTLLNPDATPDDIDCLCDEAIRHKFAAVCVQPRFAAQALERARLTSVNVASVVGFPHGATLSVVKRAEAEALVGLGVHELDMVLPVGILKANLWSEVATDIEAVVAAARQRSGKPALVKVIIETALLTDREKAVACMIAEHRGADFVKTSTGYTGGGATVEDVALMRRVVGDRLGVKAAGGIRTREQAHALIQAGATRLGTSNGCALVG